MNHTERQAVLPARAAYTMLTIVMMLWASGVIVARGVHELTAPIGFSFWRWAVAVAVLTPLAGRQLLRNWPYISARLGHFALLGLFMAGGSTLLVWSVQYTTATNAALVSAAQPTVTAVLAWVVLRERLAPVQILGIAAAAAGMVVMVARMDVTVLLELTLNPGDVLVLLAVVFYALYAINLHHWIKGLPPVLMMYLTALGGLLVLVPFYILETLFVAPFESHLPVLGAVVYMALIPTLLATTMWNISVGAVGPSRASIFINLLPVFGTGFAVLMLGESVQRYHFVGGALVCAGITLVVRRRS